MVHKFVKPKVSNYSNKLRVGLEQKNYCFKFDGQIQVGTMEHFFDTMAMKYLDKPTKFSP